MHRSAYPVIALIVLAGLAMFACRPVSGGVQDARVADGDVASEEPAVEPLSPFPVLVIWNPPDWRDTTRMLQPVDPLTLEPLPGYEPIEFEVGQAGGYVEYAIRPDGTRAAFVTHVPGDRQGQRGQTSLHLVDLTEWQVDVIDQWEYPAFSGNLARPEFSADGRTLYWFEREPLVVGEWQLKAYDLDSATQTAVATLAADFGIREHRASPGGGRIAVLGVPTQENLELPDGGWVSGSYTTGDAQVLLIDVAEGAIEETIPLDGVAAGSFGLTDVEEEDGFPVHNVSPGVVWSDDGSLLYIAHADRPGLTVVDLVEAKVEEQYDLAADDSLLERLTNWLIPSAQAIARAFSRGYAILMPGGDRLAIAMNQEHRGLDRAEIESIEHAAIQMIDTRDGEQLWQADVGGVHGIEAAPNRDHLLALTYPRIYPSNLEEFEGEHRLTLLDGETGEILGRLDLPGSPSGRLNPMIVAGEHVYVDTGGEIIVVDAETLEVAGGWQWEEGSPSVYRLIPLP